MSFSWNWCEDACLCLKLARVLGLLCPDALFLFSFIGAGANVQTLRMRLIDALESHRDTWPLACPPLEPAKYFGLGQA